MLASLPRAALTGLACLVVALAFAPAAHAERTFSVAFSANVNGNITLAGNTHAAQGSSSATVRVPADATIRFAGLYWFGKAGADVATRGPRVTLKAPGRASQVVDATRAIARSDADATYQGFADVTKVVAAAGAGSYSVGDIHSTARAGWSLVVAYASAAEPVRNLVVFDGLRTVKADRPVEIDIAAFRARASGSVRATVGFVGYEGERGVTGDRLAIANATGNATPAFEPLPEASQADPPGIDVDLVDASGKLANGTKAARVRLSTAGDDYHAGAVTFASELLAADVQQTTTVTDLNGGDVRAGDVLRYTISGSNAGQDTARELTIVDALPELTSPVTGSLVVSAGGTGELSDGRTWTITYPELAGGASYSASFDVTVDGGVRDGTTIVNTADATWFSETLGIPGEASSSATSTVSVPDLTISKSAGGPIVPGTQATYTLTVRNEGSAPTEGGFWVTEVPGPFLTPVSLAGEGFSCSLAQLRCDWNRPLPLAPGAEATITLVVNVDPDALGPIDNFATVDGGGDGDPLNNGTAHTGEAEPTADLELIQSSPVQAVAVGAAFELHFDVRNHGTSRSREILVLDHVPAGFAVTTVGPGCFAEAQQLTCTLESLAAGATHRFTVGVVARSGSGGGYENVAEVATLATPDPNPANNVDSWFVEILPSELVVTTELLTEHPTVGGPLRYRVVVENRGPSDDVGVELYDSMVGAHDLRAEGCESHGVVTLYCPIGALAAGQRRTYTVQATAADDMTAVTNTAWTSSAEYPYDNRQTVYTELATSTDLRLAQAASSASVDAGGVITYTLKARNAGAGIAFATRLSDPLPAGAAFLDGDGGCTVAADGLTCELGDLDPGAEATRTFRVRVNANPGAPAAVTNTATVSSRTPESEPADNTSAVSVGVKGADLSIRKTAGSGSVDQGGSITYTLTAHNHGPGEAENAVLSDTVPAGTTFASASPGCAPDLVGAIVCGLGDVAPGADAVRTVTVDVAEATTGTLVNTARVASDTRDDVAANDEASATVAVRGADLRLTKTASADAADQGDSITYGLNVRNLGPGRAREVTVTDILPAGTTFQSASAGCTQAAGTVTCAVGALAAGAAVDLTIRVSLQGSGTITNTATVVSPTPDPVSENNTSSVAVRVRSTDLGITKTGSVSEAEPGEAVTYIVTVRNGGQDRSSGVIVTDQLPAGTTFVSAATGCVHAAGKVTCDFGAIEAGQSRAAMIRVTIDAATVGTIRNTATVTSRTQDSGTGNNTASADVVIRDRTDLAIVKTASASEAKPGDTVTYTLKVTNGGPRTATNVVASDPLPADVTFVSATTGCSVAGRVVTCPFGTLRAGESRTVTIKAKAAAVTVPAATDTHTLKSATVETPAELTAGQTKTLTVSCAAGYVITDASVRLDDLSDVTGAKLVDVRSLQQTSDRIYTAVVRNGTSGRTRVRVEGLCLGDATSMTRSHTHSIVVTPPITGSAAIPANTRRDVTVDCGPGQTVLAPSFALSATARVAASEPTATGWRFGIEAGSAAVTANVSVRCLDALTTEAAGHVHRLDLEHEGVSERIYGLRVGSPEVTCPTDETGIVGSHDLPTGVATLGTDIDTRARRFWALNLTWTTQTATVDTTCLKYKTGAPMVIKTATNTASVSSTTPDSDASNNTSSAGTTITAGDDVHGGYGWWSWLLWWLMSGWNHR